MSYYDHATLMSLKLDRWSEERFLPPHTRREDWKPGPVCPPERRETWLAKITRRLGRRQVRA